MLYWCRSGPSLRPIVKSKLPAQPLQSLKVARDQCRPYVPSKPTKTPLNLDSSATHIKPYRVQYPLHLDQITTNYGKARFGGRDMQVVLNDKERQVCDLLNDVTQHLKQTKPELPEVVLRIAGGWVRDKLLGIESHDVDIAINSMMGYEFAQHVNAYLKANGYEARGISKIDSNPEKSKHLETATTKLLGMEVDFVNLRSEVYNEDSRIPQIQFGTPEEDAYRRDITINALFYNIHTRQVEDFTKLGVKDLQEGVIRTPLSAFETFRDDPLRVLRCIRFASRFDYALSDDIKSAIADSRIKNALGAKISRERIGTEVDKMLKGPRPTLAVDMLVTLNLYDTVFQLPASIHEGSPQPPHVGLDASKTIDKLFEKQQSKNLNLPFVISPQDAFLLHLAAILTPYRDMTMQEKAKVFPAVRFVTRESIKTTGNDSDAIVKLLQHQPRIQAAVHENAKSTMDRATMGMILREVGSRWQATVILSLAYEWMASPSDDRKVFATYEQFVKQVQEYGILECYDWKTIVDGKAVAQLLALKKPGPIMKEILDDLMRWQLNHLDANEDLAKAYVKETWWKRVHSNE